MSEHAYALPPRPASKSYGSILALLLLLAVGALTRLPAFDGRALWNDELWRALIVLDPHYFHNYFFVPNEETAITSPLYALFIKAVSIFHVSPNILRLTSFLPGVLTPLVAFLTIRKTGGSVALAFVGGLSFALNPDFVSYSNELKPYMLEVLVHLVTVYVWLAVLMVQTPRVRVWAVLFTTFVLAIITTETAVLLLPAFGVSLFAHFMIRKDWKSAAILSGGFAALAVMVGALYVLVWRQAGNAGMLSYWAAGFRAPEQSYVGFFSTQFFEMWRSATRVLVYYSFETIGSLLALVAALAWLAVRGDIWRAPLRNILIFYVVLLATFGVANAMNIWPLGAIRPNLFLFGLLLLFLYMVLAQISISRPFAKLFLVLPACFLLWHARSPLQRSLFYGRATQLHQMGAPVEQSDFVVKDFSADGPVGKDILAKCTKAKTLIVADQFFQMALDYYTKFDSDLRPDTSVLDGPCVTIVGDGFPVSHPKEAQDLFAKILAGSPQAWFVYSHNSDGETVTLKGIARHFGQVGQTRRFDGAGYFQLVADSRGGGSAP